MEEDPGIRKLFVKILAKSGIEAVVVGDEDSAIQQYKAAIACGQPFEKVLLDLNIAGKLVAVTVLERLKEIDPQVRAVVLSGDLFHRVMVDYRRFGFQAALPKPCEMRELVSVVFQ